MLFELTALAQGGILEVVTHVDMWGCGDLVSEGVDEFLHLDVQDSALTLLYAGHEMPLSNSKAPLIGRTWAQHGQNCTV